MAINKVVTPATTNIPVTVNRAAELLLPVATVPESLPDEAGASVDFGVVGAVVGAIVGAAVGAIVGVAVGASVTICVGASVAGSVTVKVLE